MPEDQDRYTQPTMNEAVYEYTLVRRKVGNPILRAKNPDKLAVWLRKLWKTTTSDEMIVVALNNENQVVGYQFILGGPGHPTFGNMEYGLDAIFRPVIQLGMKRFIIAIHQSQNLVPDMTGLDEMVRTTGQIADMLHLDFTDLMVVAQDEWVSARDMSHGPKLHALAHSIIEDLGGDAEDHARLDEHDPEDFAWAFTVLSELASTKPDAIVDAVTRRLQPLVEEMGGKPDSERVSDIEKLPDGFLSLEDLMSGPAASEPLIEEDPDGV